MEELGTLLGEALQRIVVTRGAGNQTIGIATYRSNLIASWSLYSPDLRRHTLTFEPHITDPILQDQIVGVIRSSLSEHVHEDRVQCGIYGVFGGFGNGFPLNYVLKNLLRITIAHGPSAAARSFYDATRSEHIAYQHVGLLSGVRTDRELHVSHGIRIVPLPSSTAELPPMLPDMVDIPTIQLLGRALVVVDATVSPALINPEQIRTFDDADAVFETSLVSDELPHFNLSRFCDALSLACGSSVRPAAEWNYMSEDHILNLRAGSGGMSYRPAELYDRGSSPLSQRNVRDAVSILQDRDSLPSETASKLDVPISRWVRAKGAGDQVGAFIDLGIALESIYLSDIGSGSELGFRLGIRAAWYLGKDLDERSSIMDDLRKIYDLRSRAVHTGTLPSDASIAELRARAEQLCLDSIRRVVSAGRFPDWASTVLGG
ncbi:MAG: HEPN domain-containing protein [Chloroflexi bacterium]|nr:HEPN domain-containing protein [Chloroflexota bacterium]